ncbi:MAG: hypothetical protein LH480_16100 [Rubrivivax sp.]|nr:hypothetical protein [Rubrivivax sp.]
MISATGNRQPAAGNRQRVPRPIADESGTTARGADGQPLQATERVFNPDAFTDWYLKQSGLQHRAFADFYGRSRTATSDPDEAGNLNQETRFNNPNWGMSSASNGMYHPELVRFDPNHPPRMRDGNAAGFDLEAGWVTHVSKIKEKRDWAGTVFQIGFIAVVSRASWGAGSAWATSTFGMAAGTTGNAMVAGAVAGGVASAISGTLNGNLSFKGVLRGVLAGLISAGVMRGGVGQAVAEHAGPAGTVALRSTLQGGIQALLGGRFQNGAIAGFASGLADVVSAQMNSSIGDMAKADPLSAGQDFALRGMAKVVTSAIRALGNPSDPSYAFASALVG